MRSLSQYPHVPSINTRRTAQRSPRAHRRPQHTSPPSDNGNHHAHTVRPRALVPRPAIRIQSHQKIFLAGSTGPLLQRPWSQDTPSPATIPLRPAGTRLRYLRESAAPPPQRGNSTLVPYTRYRSTSPSAAHRRRSLARRRAARHGLLGPLHDLPAVRQK